ncbi:MAG: DUF1707 domain-containing protein [Streptosporangiaceae bacterium]|nr:DUF1707 domain-containing protein [Streptosporangiaceae bacterium]
MAGPGDEIAAGAGDRGHLRASHADREQVVGTFKAAFVQGRLTKDELDLRVGQAMASRTYAELAALTADIPAGLTTAKPPTPTRSQGGQPVLRSGLVITVPTVLYAGVWVYAMFFPKGGDHPSKLALVSDTGLVYLIILATCVGLMVALRREQCSGGQSPRRPAAGAGGQASQRLPSADPGRQLPPAGHGHQHTAEAAPRRLLRTGLADSL